MKSNILAIRKRLHENGNHIASVSTRHHIDQRNFHLIPKLSLSPEHYSQQQQHTTMSELNYPNTISGKRKGPFSSLQLPCREFRWLLYILPRFLVFNAGASRSKVSTLLEKLFLWSSFYRFFTFFLTTLSIYISAFDMRREIYRERFMYLYLIDFV